MRRISSPVNQRCITVSDDTDHETGTIAGIGRSRFALCGNVWILGGYQSDFARNLTREGRDFADLTSEIVDQTLAEAMIDAADIDVVHVANAFGEVFAQQGHLGAMPATVHEGLWDTPATRHEAACASGSVAALAAMADLRASSYRTALVVGLELEKTVIRRRRRPASRRSGVDRP